jgi:UDP-N-acetylmuramate dehydrogenase
MGIEGDVTIEDVDEAIMPDLAKHLISHDTPLRTHTSLRIGGLARYYACPKNCAQLHALVAWSQENRTPYCILGGGTNTLFADSGFGGLVIHTTCLRGLQITGVRLQVAAGEMLAAAVSAACRAGLAGLEWASGIPGTVGGAVVMNAGTHEGEIANVLDAIVLLDPNGEVRVSKAALAMGYRTSALLTGELEGVITDVEFILRRDDSAACTARARQIMADRLKRQPTGASAGCVFKNPPPGPTAGQLLDQAGCRGLRSGDAAVSSLHANFIINEGAENAEDVLALIDQMRERVREMAGVELELEIVQH